MRRRTIAYILLPVMWCMVNGNVNFMNLLMGFVFGIIVIEPLAKLYRLDEVNEPAVDIIKKIPKKIVYFLVLIKEIIKANIVIALVILKPEMNIKPGLVEVPLRTKTNIGITAIANTITLTPGTLTVDIADDHSALYVHSIDATDPASLVKSIRDDLEHYVLEAFE